MFKTITKKPAISYIEPGVNCLKPDAKTYQNLDTIVENHLTGDVVNISKSIHENGEKVWMVSQIGKRARTMIFEKGHKLISDIIEKYQPNGGYLKVTRKPYLSKPSEVMANNYHMPNGKIVNGKWEYPSINLFGNKPSSYCVENKGTFYSGNECCNLIM